jgi:pantoate--beta-alanine ligase
MIVHRRAAPLSNHLGRCRGRGESIGFVPTMGALHEGHISLIHRASSLCDRVVCSIFVNPTQFNDPSDYERYPVTLESDMRMLSQAKVDLLFLPSVSEVYPEGLGNQPRYDLGSLDRVLEGEHRPGHFQGVCRVVQRLLEITAPDVIVMGSKDFQQCMVVRRLIETASLPVRLVTAETVREPNGLAMSSRNRRLSEEGRTRASTIHSILTHWKSAIGKAPIRRLEVEAMARLESEGFKPEYACICDPYTLEPAGEWDGNRPLVGLVAAWLEGVRLIDNGMLHGTIPSET